MRVVDRSFDQPSELEEHAAGPLAGGIMQHGYQCGMIWGATLAAGAQAEGQAARAFPARLPSQAAFCAACNFMLQYTIGAGGPHKDSGVQLGQPSGSGNERPWDQVSRGLCIF